MKDIEELVEFGLRLVTAKTGNSLSYIQKVILRESLCEIKKTYAQIAQENSYSESYVKYWVAPKLWQLLSQVLGEKVNKTSCRALLKQRLGSLPDLGNPLVELPPLIALEPALGQVPLASTLYVERSPLEINVQQAILQPGGFIRIKAPQKIGKTSLMARILAHAAEQNYQTARLSLHRAGTQVFASADRFLRWFCANVSRQVGLEPKLDDYWDEDMGALVSCTVYFQSYLLKELSSPVVLALDEVNQLFEYPTLARDFLALLRSWYEETRDISVWQKLRLVLVHSTEVYIPLPINRSPFNVGLAIELPPFTQAQVEDLAQRHRLQLTSFELDLLIELTGGLPYLVRLALYQCVEQAMPLAALLKDAATDWGIFSQHLHTLLWHLRQSPALVEAFQHLLEATTPLQLEQEMAFKLKSLGLVELDGNQAVISCGLYQAYFRKSIRF